MPRRIFNQAVSLVTPLIAESRYDFDHRAAIPPPPPSRSSRSPGIPPAGAFVFRVRAAGVAPAILTDLA